MASTSEILAGKAFVRLFLKNDMTRQLVRVLRNAQTKLKKFGRSAIATGRRIAVVGALMAAPFVFATRTFAEFDDAMRAVGAVTEDTGANLDMLRGKAKKLGATTSFTAIEVGLLMLELGRANFDPSEIDNMTGSVLSLARATRTEASLSAKILSRSIRQFGLAASDSSRVADVLTAAANKSLNTVESLGQSLELVGPVADDFNLSLEDTLAVLGTLGNLGIEGSMAGTAMRRILLTTGADAEKLKRIFGVEFVDMNGNVRPLVDTLQDVADATRNLGSAERAQKFKDAFGLRGITGASGIGKNIVGARDLRDAIGEAGGLAAKTAKEMDDGLGGALRILKSAIEGVRIEIGGALAPALQKLAKWMTVNLQSAIEWIKANKGMVVVAAVAAVGVIGLGVALVAMGVALHIAAVGVGALATIAAAVLLPLKLIAITLVIITAGLGITSFAFSFASKVISGVFTAALVGLKITMIALGVVFELMAFAINVTIAAMSSLITLITLGPVGILAAIVAVVVGFDLFGVVVKKTLGAVDSGFNAARGAIVGTADAIVGIKDAVVSTGAGVRSFGQTIRQTFAGAFAVVKSGFRTLVVDVGASWKTLQVLLSTGNFSEAWKLGITLAKLEWVKFKHWMLNLWDSIAPSVNKAIVAAADSIGGTLANLKIGWGNIWDTLLSGLRTFLSALDTALGEIQLRIVTIQAFFGEDTSKSGLPPLLTGLVPAGRSAEEKKTEDAAAIAQGKSVAEAIKTALVTGEKTPAELVAAIAAREKELADAINDHKDALVAAKKAAEEAVKKQQAGAGGAGAGGVGGRGGGGGAVAALAAPIGIALTATHSAAAARISGFQPGGPQQKMADGIQRIAELNEKQLESLDKFLAGWRVA